MKLRKKKCRSCGEKFPPWNSMQVACSPKCALDVGKKDVEKKERKAHKEAKERIKSRSDWLREAQQAINKYVRTRDRDKPCISCGAIQTHDKFGGTFDCGHYRSTGSAPHLRFNLNNMAKQCVKCNRYLSSNPINYRIGLIERIGEEKVALLERDNSVRKFSVDYLKRIKRIFSKKTRMMIKRRRYG